MLILILFFYFIFLLLNTEGKAETVIVVLVARIDPVATRNTAVAGIVVPTTAAQNANMTATFLVT